MVKLTENLDEIANKYNKTKDIKYKNLRYKLEKEYLNGINNSKGLIVSINSCHQADDGTYVFVGRSKLHGPVRNTKIKTNRLR